MPYYIDHATFDRYVIKKENMANNIVYMLSICITHLSNVEWDKSVS